MLVIADGGEQLSEGSLCPLLQFIVNYFTSRWHSETADVAFRGVQSMIDFFQVCL